MGSTEGDGNRRAGWSAAAQFVWFYGLWVLLPLGFAVLMFTRQQPHPAATSEDPPGDVGRQAVFSSVRAVSLSADEQYLDVMQSDAMWRRHDAYTGRELWRQVMTDVPLTKFAIRSSELVTAGRTLNERLALLEDSKVLWNGELPGQQPDEGMQSASWCGARNVAAAVSDRGSLWILELADSQAARTQHHSLTQQLDAVAWSPAGDRLAIVTADRGLLIWSVATSQIIGRLSSDDASCRFVGWSGDGRRLITYGSEKIVRVWSADTLAIVQELPLNSRNVISAELSPDGRRAAVGEGDVIGIWDLDAEGKECFLIGHEAIVSHLRFDSSGKTLFSVDCQHGMIRWSLTDGRIIWRSPN